MSDYAVAKISMEDALALNEFLTDDNKVAFHNKENDEFYTYEDVASSELDPSKYTLTTISQSVVDGSGLISRSRKIFPRP